MTGNLEKRQEDFFEEVLERIKPGEEDIIQRKIHHTTFAKIVVWLCVTSKKKNTFERYELKNFIRLSYSQLHDTLTDFVDAGFLVKKYYPSGKTYFIFIIDDNTGKPKIRKYFNQALNTLGMKPKKEIILKFEEEADNQEDSYF